MSKTGKGAGLEAQLRQAIVDSGISQRRLAALAGIHQAQLSWFLRGSKSLTLWAAGRVAEVLDLELTTAKKAR